MKRTLLATFLGALILTLGCSMQAGENHTYNHDFDKALSEAKAEKKPVFVVFTGSDWCPPCMKMEKEVISNAEFQTYLKDNAKFVFLDFPNKKKLDPAVQEKNQQLAQKFGVEAFPTFLILDGDGKVLSKYVGFQSGGPAGMIEKIKKASGKS